jgi:hypothetical protein
MILIYIATTAAATMQVEESSRLKRPRNGDETIEDSSTPVLGEYELLREQKILRNQEKLRSLGLLTLKEEQPKETKAKRSYQKNTNNHSCTTTRSNQRQPSQRQSLRLRGIDPFPTGKGKRERQLHQTNTEKILVNASSENVASMSNNVASSNTNRTTTKEHCHMRIQTMSVPSLEHRIRVIERAQGQHCIAKLTVMYECCVEAGLHDLARQANDAIKRLTNQK